MTEIQHAIILAAGRGARMMPLTADLPKAMAPFNGSTLLQHGLSSATGRVGTVHVTVGYQKSKLASHAIEHGAASVINTEGHGNAWWLFNSLMRLLDAPLLVLTCDAVGELDIAFIESEYQRLGAPACMLVPIPPVAGVEGDYLHLDEGGAIRQLSRTTPAATYASGIQVLNPTRVVELSEPQEDFHDVWEALRTQGQLMASDVYPRPWRGFDTVGQLLAAERTDQPAQP